MHAMILSDLGEELLAHGWWGQAAREQLRALSHSVRIGRVWRRLARAIAHPLLPRAKSTAADSVA